MTPRLGPDRALTPEHIAWLRRIEKNGGYWPDRPFLRSQEALLLMRLGLVEAIKPRAPNLPYVRLTKAGYEAFKFHERLMPGGP